MTFELRPDIYADHGVVTEPIARGGRFCTGKPMDLALPDPLVFIVDHTDDHPPRGMEGISIPVWSSAFVSCLRGAGVANLELFPAILRNPAGREWGDYFAVNIVGSDTTLLLYRPWLGTPRAHQAIIDALERARPPEGWGITIKQI
ncbi:MAG TPA: hypothetical protein VGL61_20605 [Kofleriaceae bacterium]